MGKSSNPSPGGKIETDDAWRLALDSRRNPNDQAYRIPKLGQLVSSSANFSAEIKRVGGRWLGKITDLFCIDR
jgi:hypothetical protein